MQAETGVPNLIADMNNSDISFSIHDGDLKAGSGTAGSTSPTTCSDALYQQSLKYLNSFQQPAFFTPGDNDWTDCDRPANGSFNSLERLQRERQLLFATDRSFGQKTMQTEVQSAPLCVGTTNTTPRLHRRPVLPEAMRREPPKRRRPSVAAGHVRRGEGERLGRRDDRLAGRPGLGPSDGTRAPLRDPKTLTETDGQPDGFKSILSKLRDLTIDFKKPVVLVHGDSHYFRIDKPFQDSQGRRLENFTRVETFGDGNNDVHWVKALIDPQSRDVFAFQPQIVPANRVAVPAP